MKASSRVIPVMLGLLLSATLCGCGEDNEKNATVTTGVVPADVPKDLEGLNPNAKRSGAAAPVGDAMAPK